METSTPLTSPKRKKHSLIQKFIPIDETLGDIESEIQLRRQEAINKSTEARRRLSAAPLLAGYTATQLTQHCKDVIKLSTENKINTKNAFNFWLIDVMAAMAKKTDSEINKNFQVASCTLDASVKIYGYRVDAIHTDAVKIAGGFFSNKDAAGGEGGGGEEGDGDADRGDEPQARTKAKKKKKKMTIVPPESLNAKSEAEVLLDVVPRQTFLTRKSDGSGLLARIPKYNDGGLLLLDSDYPCWPYGDNSESVPKYENDDVAAFDHDSLASLMSDIKLTKDECLCPAYRHFEFGRAGPTDDSDDELQMSQNSGRFEFDQDASVHDVSMDGPGDDDDEPENQRNRVHIPVGGFDSDQEIVLEPEKQKKSVNLAISEMKYRISVNPSEYSMFDEKMLRAWAGPSHWKVKPVRKPLEEFGNNEDVSKPVASKRTRKGKIKSHAGLFEILEDVLEKNLTECEKTTLFKSTMLNWSPQNTTMPKDLKCQSKNLFSLYHIPSFCVAYRSGEGDTADVSDHCDDQGNGADDDEEEFEYCSTSVLRGGDNDSHHTDDEGNPIEGGDAAEGGTCGTAGGGGDDAWDLGNMVEAPNKVERIPMSTFKRRKHVDIKHLKRGIWSLLTNAGDGDGAEGKGTRVEEAIEFRDLVKIYPSKVPKSFGCLLSSPLIFNALLHLTNEKSLVLTQSKVNKHNFVISQ